MPNSQGRLELVSTAEIADLLGLTRQRVQQLAKAPGFPEPAAVLRMGSVWHLADVRAWAQAAGRDLPGDR